MDEQYILKYRKERQLGKGGMSRVYLGVVPLTGLRVAIKVLNQDLAEDASMRHRFLVEAQSLAKLDHPDIVRLIEYDHEKLVLVQQYIEGMDLDEYITNHRGPIPEEEAKALFCKLLEAFAYVHSNKVIHRDIKPANILMTKAGQMKIVDFGIAKDTEAGRDSSSGTRMGTVAYMSPEQVLGEELDKRTDIYSLGVVLHQMLTGKAPYDISTDKQFKVQAKIVHEPLPRMKSIYEYVSSGMQAVVDKATAKDRTKRYQSCEEFLQAVRAVKPVPPPVTRDKRVIAGVVVVLLVVLGVFGYSRTQMNVEAPPELPVPAPAPAALSVPVAVDSTAIKRLEAEQAEERRKAEQQEKARQEELARLQRERDEARRQEKEARVEAERLRSKSVPAPAPKPAMVTHNVGDTYCGGIIFYVEASGQHGLIAATKDMLGHTEGYSEGHFSWNDAIARCSDFNDKGYSDWRLPTKNELNKLYYAKTAVGGFSGDYYWSSSESGASGAWVQNFGDGRQFVGIDKGGGSRVRPVRAF